VTGIDLLESAVLRDTGRRVEMLAGHAIGGLAAAATALTSASSVAIVTGFAVPSPRGAAPETDGPIGAAAVAHLLEGAGRRWVMVTDAVNSDVCAGALAAHDLPQSMMIATTDREVDRARADLDAQGVTLLVFIERLGPNSRGQYLSMAGIDMSAETARLDRLLEGGTRSIGIGDGGNEIGMGRVPPDAVASAIHRGEDIHCVVPTDALILAGVSNWGAWALVGAAALVSDPFRDPAAAALSMDLWREALRLMVEAGAVDGVTLSQSLSVDGLDPEIHEAVLSTIRVASELE
jgi:hypothetical protein